MNEKLQKYLSNERELARYNISMLNRREHSAAQKRLIKIEQEFIDIPFENFNFKNTSELTDAIDLYRNSRNLFYIKYKIINNEHYITNISKKSIFLDRLSSDIFNKRIHEINLVQDEDFHTELKNYLLNKNKISSTKDANRLKLLSLEELLKLEPLTMAKKRAKLQSALYSLGLGISEFVDEINSQNNFQPQQLDYSIDDFINTLPDIAYRRYNDGLSKISSFLSESMGRNDTIDKVYPLVNIFTMHTHASANVYNLNKNYKIDFSQPKIYNLYFGIKDPFYDNFRKDADKQTKNRIYGILFPFERISREKMTLLYKEIYSDNINISELFSDSISNIRVSSNGKANYYKGILLKPAWELLKLSQQNYQYSNFLSKLWQTDLSDLSKFEDQVFVKKFNSTNIIPINIDTVSKIYIPQTRSEEDSFSEIMPLLYKRIETIVNDYKNLT